MRRSLHGVEVALTGPLPAALLDGLLGGFPPGDPATPPHLTIDLSTAAGPPPRGRPIFFHGPVQAFEVEGSVVLSDGASWARLPPGGARIELAVHPASLADRQVFEHVLALVALVVTLRGHGLFHLHAAAVLDGDGRAVLVAGQSGSGKSTLALALIEHGLHYLGDDAVFLSRRRGEPVVLSFPRLFHVSEATAGAFPRLRPLLGERYAAGGKWTLDPRRAFPGQERPEAGAPSAVLFPEVSGEARTSVERLPPAEALGALMESSAHLAVEAMPAVGPQLELLAAAADGARGLRVRLGRDLLERPGRSVGCILAALDG